MNCKEHKGIFTFPALCAPSAFSVVLWLVLKIAMPIRPGTSADLPFVRQLMHSSRRYLNGGLEDLPDLLSQAVTAVGEAEPRVLWGFVAFRIEPRPSSLPTAAPDRVTLRAAAVVQRLFSANRLPALLQDVLAQLRAAKRPLQLVALTDQTWLTAALQQVDFAEVDQVRFYLRTQQNVPTVPEPAELRALQATDLEALAQLDGETFPPLWHMGRSDLLQLCFSSRVQVAIYQGQIVGYTAVALQSFQDDPLRAAEAQIVRLAVHPAFQRYGVGRQLLADCLRYAHGEGVYRVQLNTQESNKASQRLYESFGFRRQGRNVPVLVHQIAEPSIPP